MSAAGILALAGFANVFGWILVSERIPQALADAVLSLTDNKFPAPLPIDILLQFVGMCLETIAALISLFAPLLALSNAVGIDPIHFATVAVLALTIGPTTPPVGVRLFVCANIARLSLAPVVAAILPFLLTDILMLCAVTYIPPLATWLPCVLSPLGTASRKSVSDASASTTTSASRPRRRLRPAPAKRRSPSGRGHLRL